MSEFLIIVLAVLAFAIWVYLLVSRGAFWLGSQRDDHAPAPPPAWPSVAIVIPARNEADCIGPTIDSLLRQDYPGEWSITLVDDKHLHIKGCALMVLCHSQDWSRIE